jgi:hypothetical protein
MVAGMVVAGLVLGTCDAAWACPNCKDTLAEHGGRLQYGYALSIGLMIAAPFGILGGWALAIYRMLKSPA